MKIKKFLHKHPVILSVVAILLLVVNVVYLPIYVRMSIAFVDFVSSELRGVSISKTNGQIYEECEHLLMRVKGMCYQRKALLSDEDANRIYFRSAFYPLEVNTIMRIREKLYSFSTKYRFINAIFNDEVFQKAEKGDRDMQRLLGVEYALTRNFEKAMYWFKKADKIGNAETRFIMAEMYERGLGVPQDFNKAIELYKKIEERVDDEAGDVSCPEQPYYFSLTCEYVYYARFKLAEVYKKQQDYKQAQDWYVKATEDCSVNKKSQEELNMFFEEYLDSLRYIKYPYDSVPQIRNIYCGLAYYGLSEMYEKGLGVNQNHQKAVESYYFASIFGDEMAKYHLGKMYLDGIVVEKDESKAKRLINASHSIYAKKFLEEHPELVESRELIMD